MNSICWAGSQSKVDKIRPRGVLAPFFILAGLWAINIMVITFGLPILAFAKLRRLLLPEKPPAGVRVSKPDGSAAAAGIAHQKQKGAY